MVNVTDPFVLVTLLEVWLFMREVEFATLTILDVRLRETLLCYYGAAAY